MAGGLEHFCPVRGLVQLVSSVVSLRRSMLFRTVVVVLVFLGGGGAVDGRDASDFGPISRATS